MTGGLWASAPFFIQGRHLQSFPISLHIWSGVNFSFTFLLRRHSHWCKQTERVSGVSTLSTNTRTTKKGQNQAFEHQVYNQTKQTHLNMSLTPWPGNPSSAPPHHIYIYIHKLLQHVNNVVSKASSKLLQHVNNVVSSIKSVFQVTSTC